MSSLDHQHMVHRINRNESMEYSRKWETQAVPLFYIACYAALAWVLITLAGCATAPVERSCNDGRNVGFDDAAIMECELQKIEVKK